MWWPRQKWLPNGGFVSIGWATQCCGEHLYSAEEVRLHNERYHPRGN